MLPQERGPRTLYASSKGRTQAGACFIERNEDTNQRNREGHK